MKKQEEKISKKYDVFSDDDDEMDFPTEIPFKMEDDFPSDYDDDGDVLVKKERDKEINDKETIPFVSPKRENDIDNRESILYTSPKRESEDEIDEKRYKELKLKTLVEIEQQAEINDRNFMKSELEQNKVDLKLSKEAELKRLLDVFDEVKKPLDDIDTFLIPDNDVFDSDDISGANRGFIMDLINQTTFIADVKMFVEDTQASQIEITNTPTEKIMEKREQNSIDKD